MSEPPPTSEKFSSPEPEHSPTSEPEASHSAGEPLPVWALATASWQWGWDLHWIGLGCLFGLLAVYALCTLILVSSRETTKRRLVWSVFISAMLFVFGVSRALFLFTNPYESPQCNVIPQCSVLVTRILFSIGLPCLSAAFSFIQLVFIQVMKLRLYPRKVQNWKFLFALITVHFSLALIVELLVYLYADWRVLSLVCQVFFIVLSLALSTSFLYTGRKIIKHVSNSAQRVSRLGSLTRPTQSTTNKTNVTKLVKITYFTAALGFVSCLLQMYAIFFVYDMYRTAIRVEPEPWSWLIFQSLYRIVELLAGATMAYVCLKQPSARSRTGSSCLSLCKREQRFNAFVLYSLGEADTANILNNRK